jgi:hypothetical protein
MKPFRAPANTWLPAEEHGNATGLLNQEPVWLVRLSRHLARPSGLARSASVTGFCIDFGNIDGMGGLDAFCYPLCYPAETWRRQSPVL